MRKFDVAMCIAWLVITIIYAVLAIEKIDVSADCAMWPCLVCTGSYFGKIFDRRDK